MSASEPCQLEETVADNAAAPWRRFGLLTAGLLTLWVVTLHTVNLFSAGPLWRDEVGSVDFAVMSGLGEIWSKLRYDNFPLLFVTVARVWTRAGLTSDFSYRLLGFLIGTGTVGAFWWCARKLGGHAPLLGLALYAVNPMAIRVGDSLRPYGVGILMILLALTTLWNFVRAPGRRTLAWAMLAATLCVQSLYQNAFFIVAFCCGAWVVAFARKEWKTAWQTGLVGVVAALSLLPYLAVLKEGEEWRMMSRREISFDEIWTGLRAALDMSGGWMAPVWLTLLAAGVVAAVGYGIRQQRWCMVYCGVALVASAVLHLLFLRFADQPPRTWYFLILMAPAALMLDSIFGELAARRLQMARAALGLILALACVSECYAGVRVRQSNIDLVAAKLKESAQPGDLILVTQWYFGVSLQRYFDASRWTTVPPLEDLRIHRYDLLKQALEKKDPIGPLLKQVETTLRSGHALWVVGGLQKPDDPNPLLLTQLVYRHEARVDLVDIPVPGGQPVSFFENVPLMVVHGWKEQGLQQ